MKRRAFLQTAGAATTGAAFGRFLGDAGRGAGWDLGRSHGCARVAAWTPVAADVDVLVGAGPAGVGAALAAARGGARTLLVERHGMLGGVWTAGLLNPFYDFKSKGWLVAEIIQRLEAAGAWADWKDRRVSTRR